PSRRCRRGRILSARRWNCWACNDFPSRKRGNQTELRPVTICKETSMRGRPRTNVLPGGKGNRLRSAKNSSNVEKLRSPSASRICSTVTWLSVLAQSSWIMRDNRRCGGSTGSGDGSEDIVGLLSNFNAMLSACIAAGRTFYGHYSYWHLIASEFKDVEYGLAL